jgi:hypothetical protein
VNTLGRLYETDDSGFADIAIYSTVDMAKQNMDYITGDATKEQLLECIDDMNAFNKVYNNKTSTNFGYFVLIHHLIQVRIQY